MRFLRHQRRLGSDPAVLCWVSFLYPTYDRLTFATNPKIGSKPNTCIYIDFPLTLKLYKDPI